LFNKSHKHKKRGIAATPVKFGISFTALFFNQVGQLQLLLFIYFLLQTRVNMSAIC